MHKRQLTASEMWIRLCRHLALSRFYRRSVTTKLNAQFLIFILLSHKWTARKPQTQAKNFCCVAVVRKLFMWNCDLFFTRIKCDMTAKPSKRWCHGLEVLAGNDFFHTFPILKTRWKVSSWFLSISSLCRRIFIAKLNFRLFSLSLFSSSSLWLSDASTIDNEHRTLCNNNSC